MIVKLAEIKCFTEHMNGSLDEQTGAHSRFFTGEKSSNIWCEDTVYVICSCSTQNTHNPIYLRQEISG
jgi:hypothetical protein